MVGAIQGPLAQLVSLLQAPQRELAYILARRGETAAEPAADTTVNSTEDSKN